MYKYSFLLKEKITNNNMKIIKKTQKNTYVEKHVLVHVYSQKCTILKKNINSTTTCISLKLLNISF